MPNAPFTVHVDPAARRQEYLDGLRFYSSALDAPVYFLENSTYDLDADDEFQALFRDRDIRLLKLPVSDRPERGKGYQEFAMLDRAAEALGDSYESFIKVTGRHIYLNIKRMCAQPPEGIIIDMHLRSHVAVTAAFYATFAFYRRFLSGTYAEADDKRGRYIEHCVYERLQDPGIGSHAKLFPVEPEVIARQASTGRIIDSRPQSAKRLARHVERALLRRLSINRVLI